MTTLPERLQDVIVEFRRIAKDHEIRADRPHQDDATCQWHMGTSEAYDDAADRLEAAQALQAQEVVKETTINHARDPHCCGCYVIRWNDGDPVAVCGECGVQVALLDRIVSGALECTPPQKALDGVAKVAAEILFYANDEAQCWDAANQKWIIYRDTLKGWAERLTLTQQQGGEQEAVDIDAGMMIRACTAYNEVIPLSGFYSQRPLAMRAALTAALRTKQPAASEGDGCAMCSRWKALAESADLLRSVAEKRAARLEAHAGEAVAYAEAEYEFEVWQDDFVQAGGTAPTVEEVMTEAGHYAMMYGQDGPVRVRYYERREFKPIAAALQAGTP